MKLTLLRHGETEENLHNIIQGQRGGHLSELGKQQVLDTALKLKDKKYDIIYSSDLARCVDTAEPIHKYHKDTPLHYDKAIREISLGKFEGKHAIFLKIGARIGGALNLKAPGGENWGDLTNRVIPFLNKVYSKHPNDKVLIISHGGPIKLMISLLSTDKVESPHTLVIPNCTTWELDMNQPIEIKK